MVIAPLIIEKLYPARVEPRLRDHPLYKFAPTRRLAIKASGRSVAHAARFPELVAKACDEEPQRAQDEQTGALRIKQHPARALEPSPSVS